MNRDDFIRMELEEDFTHPFNLENGRYICNENHPRPKNAPAKSRWEHEEAREEADFGDVVRMKCDVCGESWKEELPQ